MSDQSFDLDRIAIHEAGHAVVGHALGMEPHGDISTTPVVEGGGITLGFGASTIYGITSDHIEVGVRTLHAGALALRIAADVDWQRGATDDYRQIEAYLSRGVAGGAYRSAEEAQAHSDSMKKDAAWILGKRLAAVLAVTDLLIERETVQAEQVHRIIDAALLSRAPASAYRLPNRVRTDVGGFTYRLYEPEVPPYMRYTVVARLDGGYGIVDVHTGELLAPDDHRFADMRCAQVASHRLCYPCQQDDACVTADPSGPPRRRSRKT